MAVKFDPAQQLADTFTDFSFVHAADAERQSYVVKGGQMVQQAEVLKNDADFPPQHGKVVTVGEVNVGSKNVDRTAARFLCEIHHTEQRRFAGSALAGQKMERAFFQREFYIA